MHLSSSVSVVENIVGQMPFYAYPFCLTSFVIEQKLHSSPCYSYKGKWLEERGLKCGEYVEVEVEGDKITLTKTTPPEKESPKTISEKIKDLDENQLAKLTKFIDKL